MKLETIHDRLRYLRIDSGLSQVALSREIRISKNYVCFLENGRRNPSYKVIADYTEFFNANEDWILTGDGDIYRQEQEIPPSLAEVEEPDTATLAAEARARILRNIALLTDDEILAIDKVFR